MVIMVGVFACKAPIAAPCSEYDEAEQLFNRLADEHLDTSFGHPSFEEVARRFESVPAHCPRQQRAQFLARSIRNDLTTRRTEAREIARAQAVARERKLQEQAERVRAQRTAVAAQEVVLYTTAWCGVCKQAKRVLNDWGVSYIEKDVERMVGARDELMTKATRAGVETGVVPVIDVAGTIMTGLDEGRLRAALQRKSLL